MATAVERQRAAVLLRAERVFLRSMMESLREGIVACDAEGNLRVVNEATRRFSGGDRHPPASHVGPITMTSTCLTASRPFPFRTPRFTGRWPGRGQGISELLIAPPRGRKRTLLANGQPIYDNAGYQLGAVVALHDVTERNQVEAELERRTFRTLTGLPNRALFVDCMSHSITSAGSGESTAAVVVAGVVAVAARAEIAADD